MFEESGTTNFHVIDWSGMCIAVGRLGDESMSAQAWPKSLVGTPSYQPSTVVEGVVSPLSDIYAAAMVVCQVLACEGEILCEDGSTTLAVSMRHNKVSINGLGTIIGGSEHQALMQLEREKRDWHWREEGLPPPKGTHLVTKLLGILQANDIESLQSLNTGISFPIATVHKVFGNGDEKIAAEKLMRVLVYKACSLKQRERRAGLNKAILASRALAHCAHNIAT